MSSVKREDLGMGSEEWAEAEKRARAEFGADPDRPGAALRLSRVLAQHASTRGEAWELALVAGELAGDDAESLLAVGNQLVRIAVASIDDAGTDANAQADEQWALVTTLLGIAGRLATARGHVDKAERALRAALEACPESLEAGRMLARHHADGGLIDRARAVANQTLRWHPTDRELSDLVGDGRSQPVRVLDDYVGEGPIAFPELVESLKSHDVPDAVLAAQTALREHLSKGRLLVFAGESGDHLDQLSLSEALRLIEDAQSYPRGAPKGQRAWFSVLFTSLEHPPES